MKSRPQRRSRLANGFPVAARPKGNYAVNKYYRLPYVQVWNINVQRTLPLGIVLNIGYNGSKGTRLDIVDAPGRSATESLSGVFYDYEDSVAFSNYNALTVSARKRLQRGIAPGRDLHLQPLHRQRQLHRRQRWAPGQWWRKTGRTCWPKNRIRASTYATS